MKTNYILVDYESVQPNTLPALDPEQFKLIVFAGATQTKVSIEMATAMQALGSSAKYIRISGSGKNALDFHIAFYIGEIAAQDPNAFFHIISKDGGFDPLIQHLKTRKILSVRSATIEDIPLIKGIGKKSPKECATVFMEHLAQPKSTKPKTLKTLNSAINTHFQKQLSDTEVEAVIEAMSKAGFITIQGNKVDCLTQE